MDNDRRTSLASALDGISGYVAAARASSAQKEPEPATKPAGQQSKTEGQQSKTEGQDASEKYNSDMPDDFVPWGVTSLADLRAWRSSQQAHHELIMVVSAMNEIASNIFMDQDITDKPGAILNLAEEFVRHVQDMIDESELKENVDPGSLHPKIKDDLSIGLLDKIFASEKPEIVCQSKDGSVVMYRAKDGGMYLYGRPTNRWRDRDVMQSPQNGGEIITDAAHKEYNAYLDDNPSMRPELWFLHEEETKFKNRAAWHDYSDGFLHFVWAIEPDEEIRVKRFIERYTPGMSHTFRALERDEADGLILKYRMEESSLLPVEMAANVWAGFNVIGKELGKMFSEDKRAILIDVFGSDWVDRTEKENAVLREQLDQHLESKAKRKGEIVDTVKIEAVGELTEPVIEPVADIVTEQAPAPTVQVVKDSAGVEPSNETQQLQDDGSVRESEIAEILFGLREELVNAIGDLNNRIDELEKSREKEQQTSGMTLAAFKASMSGVVPQSVTDNQNAHVPSQSMLAKMDPTQNQATNGHQLASLF